MQKKRQIKSQLGLALLSAQPPITSCITPKLLHFKLVSLQCAIAYFVLLITSAFASASASNGYNARMLSIGVSRSGQSPRFSSLPAGRTKTVTWHITWPAGRPAYCSYNVSARHYRQRSLVFEFLRDWKRYESIHVERGPTVSRVGGKGTNEDGRRGRAGTWTGTHQWEEEKIGRQLGSSLHVESSRNLRKWPPDGQWHQFEAFH